MSHYSDKCRQLQKLQVTKCFEFQVLYDKMKRKHVHIEPDIEHDTDFEIDKFQPIEIVRSRREQSVFLCTINLLAFT